MKTNSLLFLASLAVLTSSASAALNQPEPETVVLPTYVVTAPHCQPAERRINASLEEFRRQALVPMVIAPELGLLNAQTARHRQLADTANRARLDRRIAKS
ncbi:MAG: hypothetical protein HYV75_11110 [Opitutae bacterium]|nr:hypothetical protein [Opitutae bacterium]